jgi:GNAT superfamily N-acetyltransferase
MATQVDDIAHDISFIACWLALGQAGGMTDAITIRALQGDDLRAAIPQLAALRITVFSEYPYLYHGDGGYEAGYLREFMASPGAVLVAALDGDKVVGAATASPMTSQKPAFQEPFAQRGLDVGGLFYFGESVLLPSYRGRGIGHAFFDHREQQARAQGAKQTCFCAVIRPDDHPLRPADYRPHDVFWRGRGYAPVEGFIAHYDWKDHGEAEASAKPMQFWLKDL